MFKTTGLKAVGTAAGLAAAALSAAPGVASADGGKYTVNGAAVAPEMGMLLEHYGFEPGAYYIDADGNYGRSGAAPTGNLNGGPTTGWSGVEPTTVAGNPYAEAYVNGVTGARIFWVYSPSIMSDVKGGGSGYYHICPGNVYYASSEGSVSMSDRYSGKEYEDPGAGRVIGSSVGVAGAGASSGRWAIEPGAAGPDLVGYASDGGTQRVPIATMLQGSWSVGQTKYAVEPGKASCR